MNEAAREKEGKYFASRIEYLTEIFSAEDKMSELAWEEMKHFSSGANFEERVKAQDRIEMNPVYIALRGLKSRALEALIRLSREKQPGEQTVSASVSVVYKIA